MPKLHNDDIVKDTARPIVFLKSISKQDIEFLSKWKNNRSLFIGFQTKGLANVDGSILEFELGLPINQFKLGIDDFESIFLKNTGLQYTYGREFELSSALIDNLPSKGALYELYDYICNLQNNLEQALRVLRLSGDILEVLVLIRQPLDGIKELKNNPTWIKDIARQLYVNTNILTDLNPSAQGGGETAAKEIVFQLFSVFNILFEFSSKAFHTKIKYQQQSQPQVLFKMNPDYHDAEFSLTLALTTTNYLISRIQRSCKTP
jgi:hypothetical protein